MLEIFRIDETGNLRISREGCLALLVVTQGSAVVRAAGLRWSVIAPGALCFGEDERQEIESTAGIKGSGVFFRPSMINAALTCDNIRGDPGLLSLTDRLDRDFLSPFVERSADYFGFIPMGPALIGRAISLIALLEGELDRKSDGYWPCRSRSYLLELVFLMFKVYKDDGAGRVQVIDDSISGRVIRFIQINMTERILVDDLCRRFETNKTTLNRLMRQATGYPAIEYLNRQRIQSACLLLRDTGLPVQEIAYRAGFNDIVHFGRMFRKYTRVAPRKYRELHRR
jgi:AraC-like DNA-binding protein